MEHESVISPWELVRTDHWGNYTKLSQQQTMISTSKFAYLSLSDQIEIARQVQAAFLPKTCNVCTGAQVVAQHLMSNGVGGDLYDFVPHDDQTYSFVIGDVIVHELFSALVMSLIFGTIHAVGPKADSPLNIITVVNNLLCELNE